MTPHNLKINWFSPLPPAKTGIADYTWNILPTLAERAEVTLWTDQSEWLPQLEQYAKVKYYSPAEIDWLSLKATDMTVYHIGNNLSFHTTIWYVSRRHPGIVILHDPILHGFFAPLLLNHWKNPEIYLAKMNSYYGIEGSQSAKKFLNGELTMAYMLDHYPLTPMALEGAVGAIVHYRPVVQEVSQQQHCRVEYAPLPYAPIGCPSTPKILNSPYQLIIFGHLGGNRRVEAILEALSSFPEKDRFHLHIYGELYNHQNIQNKFQSLKLTHLVSLHGFVSDSILDTALSKAHLAINLRYPTVGEASLSQLRIWSHALPTLVTPVGWYADLPDNTVFWVRPNSEIADIHRHLANFLANPNSFLEKGENGYQWLLEQHSPKKYVTTILEFAQRLTATKSLCKNFEISINLNKEET